MPSSCGTGSADDSSTSVCTIGPQIEHALMAAASFAASASRIWQRVSRSVETRQCSERSAPQSRSTASGVYSHPTSGLSAASTPQRAVPERSSVARRDVGAASSVQIALTASTR